MVLRRSRRAGLEGSARGLLSRPFANNVPSKDILDRVPIVFLLVSLSVSDPDRGVSGIRALAKGTAGAGVLLLGSFPFEDVEEVVFFLLSRCCCCWSPLRADIDIVEGFENVTPDRDELPDTLLRRGKFDRSGELDTVCGVRAVVGVEMAEKGGIPIGIGRTVMVDVFEALRRLEVFLSAVLDAWRCVDSDGRAGNGGGMERGGRV